MEDENTHDPRRWHLRWLLLVPLAVLYGICLPRTVQTLDTGEVVAAAWKLTVAHPPGYPLFVWLQHGFMKAWPWGTVFFRAALANALCALGTVALMLRMARSWVAVALIGALATTSLVWRYAVLPDVFGLHLLASAVLLALAFREPGRLRLWGSTLAFGLGAANHQSIIFLLPLLALVVLEHDERTEAFAALSAGCAVTVSLYASLLLLDSQSLSAWTSLSGPADILSHFLRRSYGTFQLSGYETRADVLAIVSAFAKACSAPGAAAALLVVAGFVQRHGTPVKEWRRWCVTLVCLLAYFAVFFPRMNSGAHPLHDGVRERFFLFPMVLLGTLAVRVRPRRLGGGLDTTLAVAIALVAVAQAVQSDAYGLRDDTVVEDYARNLLNLGRSAGKPALVVVETDTQLFASYYVKAIDASYDDVVPVGIGNIFLVDRLEKMKKRWPEFVYDPKEIFESDRRNLFRDFIAPNLGGFAVYSVVPVTNPNWRTTFFPLGRRIEPGQGIAIADAPVTLRPPVFRAGDDAYVETKELFADYAVQHLARGKLLLAAGDNEGAKRAFLVAAQLVPYCIPCLSNFCKLDEHRDGRCNKDLEELQHYGYRYLE